MKIDIFTKNISLDRPLKDFVEDKIGSLEKFTRDLDPVEARVEIGKGSRHHRSGMIFYAETNLTVKGALLRAESTSTDLRVAISDTKEELQIQLKKYKEKMRDKPAREAVKAKRD
jgi:ribosomal subunit interface protein